MANKDLVYLSDVRRALLRFEPEAVYTLQGLRRVDAVEVVRCRDCKSLYTISSGHVFCRRYFTFPVKEDDYCSYGERRCDNEAD